MTIELDRDAPVTPIAKETDLGWGELRIRLPGEKLYHYSLGCWIWSPEDRYSTRAELLSFLWGMEENARPIYLTLTCAALFSVLGFVLLLPPRKGSGKSRAVKTCAVFLLALGLGAAYSVIAPPFHTPDEPDHFLSYAKITDNPKLIENAEFLAKRGRFQLIRHWPRQTFHPSDRSQPYDIAWDSHITESEMEARSALTAALWRFFGAVFHSEDAGLTLLGLRLFHSILFALSAALGALFLLRSPLNKGAFFPYYIFIVPALPFYGMHVSNYAIFTDLCIILGSINLSYFIAQKESAFSGFLYGVLFLLLSLSCPSAQGLAAWICCIILLHFFMEHDSTINLKSRNLRSAFFFSGFILCVLGLWSFRDSVQVKTMIFYFSHSLSSIFPSMAKSISLNGIMIILFSITIIIMFLDMLKNMLFANESRKNIFIIIRNNICRASIIAAAVWLIFLIASIFLDFKELPNNAQEHVSLSQYILLTLKYLPTLITFREPDMLLATPFWGGFGWHDANLPRTIIEILAGGAGVGLLLLLVHVWKTKARARALWLGIWGLGALGTGVLTAALLYLHGSPNLNGRYLIGFYMIVLSICFSGYSFWLRELSERAGPSARAAAAGSAVNSCGAAVCVALHGYSLLLIMFRYFG